MKHLILFLILSISLLGQSQQLPEVIPGTYTLFSDTVGISTVIVTKDKYMLRFDLENLVSYLNNTKSSIRNVSSAKYYIEELITTDYRSSNMWEYVNYDEYIRFTTIFLWEKVTKGEYETSSVSLYFYKNGSIQFRDHNRGDLTTGAVRKSPFDDNGVYNNIDEVCLAFAKWYVKVYVE